MLFLSKKIVNNIVNMIGKFFLGLNVKFYTKVLEFWQLLQRILVVDKKTNI